MIKDSLGSLAVFGGPPAFGEKLHVGRPNLGNRAKLLERVNNILDNCWLTNNGPYVQELEQHIAHMVGARHCIAVCNATVALVLAIRALELRGEVIVPSFTFVATAHALQWEGVTPIFTDIDPSTHNLDPARIEQMITPRSSGIIGVHLWGRPCNVEALEEIAARHKLKLLFDAAHALGCSFKGTMIGTFGDAEVLSFHATKVINSFEGGAVVTNNESLANKLRLMRNFGFAGYDNVTQLGLNGKMTEVCAAMGLTSLEAMPEIMAVNRQNYETYKGGLTGFPGISLIEYDVSEHNNYHYIVIDVDSAKAPLHRDELLAVLRRENVLARKYFWPGCHRMSPYSSLYPDAYLHLAQTERIASQVLVLPTGQSVTPEIIRVICDLILCAFENAGEIRKFLEKQPANG
jgi:dTDP-4-amino-4,6-dideoxygalactose transaminase